MIKSAEEILDTLVPPLVTKVYVTVAPLYPHAMEAVVENALADHPEGRCDARQYTFLHEVNELAAIVSTLVGITTHSNPVNL